MFLEERLSPDLKKSIWELVKRASIKAITAASQVINTAKEQKSQVVKKHSGPFSRTKVKVPLKNFLSRDQTKRDLISYLVMKSVEHLRQKNVPLLVSANGETHETADSFPAHENH